MQNVQTLNTQRFPLGQASRKKIRHRRMEREQEQLIPSLLSRYIHVDDNILRDNFTLDIDPNFDYSSIYDRAPVVLVEIDDSVVDLGYQKEKKRYMRQVKDLFSIVKSPLSLTEYMSVISEPEDDNIKNKLIQTFNCSDVLVSLYRHELNERFSNSFSEKVPIDLLKPDKQPDQVYRNFITEIIEGILTNKAHRHALVGEFNDIPLTKGYCRLTEAFCMELINRLDLDPYKPTRILFQIYQDIIKSINKKISYRKWGNLVKSSTGEIVMNVQCDDYLQEFYSDIDDSLWQSS